jgi:hypothetical protein
VGGAVRDRLLGRTTFDLDVVMDGAVEPAAKASGAPARPLPHSRLDAFGVWRVVARTTRGRSTSLPVNGAGIEEDLAARDFLVNAIAEPLAGGEAIDPFEAARTSPPGACAWSARWRSPPIPCACCAPRAWRASSKLEPDATPAPPRGRRPRHCAALAPERVFGELKRIVVAPRPCAAWPSSTAWAPRPSCSPSSMPCAASSRALYRHLDVYDHDPRGARAGHRHRARPEPVFGDQAGTVAALLVEPLADELDRAGAALRRAAARRGRRPRAGLGRGEGDVHRPRPRRRRPGARGARPPPRLRASACPRRRADPQPPRLGFLVHQAADRPARGSAKSDRVRAGGRRRRTVLRRPTAWHAGRKGEARSSSTWSWHAA